ncbi:G-protein coupled receptor 84-like [Magallana gigas]|uniref:G-protein coupled receptor 84-like n=1 Tax=Magallana gigas TaxID=29159 RepID=UPI00333E9691
MDNETFYQFHFLNRYSDIALSSSILIIIGAVIGSIGNVVIIVFYFFRIKERGERYFIPLLGIVDLLGCLTSPPYYIMDNEYMFDYPSTAACRILTFLQFCIPGISGHTLLVISIQRYLLVCKPFGPKMTHFWKRVSFGIVCLFSFAYSVPLLATAGVFRDEVVYMNHNVTTEVCKLSGEKSLSMSIYTILLSVIMVANLILTAGLYIPVLRQVKISFRSRTGTYEIHRDSNAGSTTETSQTTRTSDIEIDNPDKPSIPLEMEVIETRTVVPNSPKKGRFASTDTTNKQADDTIVQNDAANHVANGTSENVAEHHKTAKNKPKSKSASAQRRVSIMFLFLIAAYVVSYTPALIVLNLFYLLDGFTFHTLTRANMAVWIFLTRLVFLNHIVNPFIYGYFDSKFKKQLRKSFQRKK